MIIRIEHYYPQLERIMSQIEDVNEKLDELSAAVEASNNKQDQMIQAIADLRNAGTGATPEQIEGLLAKVNAIRASVDQQTAEDTGALA